MSGTLTAMREVATTDMTDKVVVVTGANAGIGKETAVALASMGATVVMTARDARRGATALDEVVDRSGNERVTLGSLDLGSLDSVEEFASWLARNYGRLDVLVNNAGGITGDRRETADGFEQMFGVNHLGHFHLTNLLTPLLVESAPSRVVVVASTAHHWAWRGLPHDDLQSKRRFSGSRTYGRSKLANVLHTRELARRLDGTGVTVNAVHPGSVNSHFGGDGDTALMGELQARFGRYLLRTPEAGARTSVLLASSAKPEVAGVTGQYFANGRARRPSRQARRDGEARWLWDESERLIAAVRP